MKKPTIGITLDWEKEGSFSNYPHYALREHYFNAIINAGGTPIGIPQAIDNIDEYMSILDGILISGGMFRFPDEWYIDEDEPAPYTTSPRLEMDIKIIEKSLENNIPILGICAGMQILGGISGCKMTRNIHKHVETTTNHLDSVPTNKTSHNINVIDNTLLSSICNKTIYKVNSHHSEAIIDVKNNVIISAISEDNVIEAIELVDKKFALGIQWHPEYLCSDIDKNIISAFVKASSNYIRPAS